MEWALENGAYWTLKCSAAAAENGHLHILRFARDNGFRFGAEAGKAAALGGCTDLLLWIEPNPYKWPYSVFQGFAEGGQTQLLEKFWSFMAMSVYALAQTAARAGHLEAFKWVYAKEDLVSSSLLNVGFDLEWAEQQGLVLKGVHLTPKQVSNFDVINFFVSSGLKSVGETVTYAAAKQSVKFLEWAVAHGAQLMGSTFAPAVAARNWDTIQWLKEHDCPWDHQAFDKAAALGNMKLLTWLKNNSCPQLLRDTST